MRAIKRDKGQAVEYTVKKSNIKGWAVALYIEDVFVGHFECLDAAESRVEAFLTENEIQE